MALVIWRFQLTIWFADTQDDQVTRTWEMQATDYATALTDAATVISRVEAVSDAEIAGFNVSGKYYEDDYTNPGNGVQNENQAVLLLLPTNESNPYPTVSIPAINDSVMKGASGPDNNIVDITNTDVLAFVGLFITDAELYLSDGETVQGLVSGERVHVAIGAL